MIDVITATIAGLVGFVALVGLMLWAQSQRGRVVRRRELCVCTPGREMGLTEVTTHPAIVEVSRVRGRTGSANIPQVDTESIDIMLERHRHEMSEAIERERHYRRVQEIQERRQIVAIPRPAQTAPQPARKPQRALPEPHSIEIPAETTSVDGGLHWVALERTVKDG